MGDKEIQSWLLALAVTNLSCSVLGVKSAIFASGLCVAILHSNSFKFRILVSKNDRRLVILAFFFPAFSIATRVRVQYRTGSNTK